MTNDTTFCFTVKRGRNHWASTKPNLGRTRGKVDNWGYEVSTNWRKQLTKDLTVDFRGTFTHTQNKYIDLDEPIYPYVWQTATGKPLEPQKRLYC